MSSFISHLLSGLTLAQEQSFFSVSSNRNSRSSSHETVGSEEGPKEGMLEGMELGINDGSDVGINEGIL